jgi:hypothetical protein
MKNRMFRAAAAAPLLIVMLAGAAVTAETGAENSDAEGPTCEEQALSIYNNCLMSSTNALTLALCDLAFMFNYAHCKPK